MTSEQLEMISADPQVMHGQAVIAGTRVPVSVILDCLAAGMTTEEITAEYPAVTTAGVRGRRLWRGAGTRGTAAAAAAVKFKLDENLPASSAVTLARAGHDADTVRKEGMTGAPDPDVVAAATAAGRILISLDVGMSISCSGSSPVPIQADSLMSRRLTWPATPRMRWNWFSHLAGNRG